MIDLSDRDDGAFEAREAYLARLGADMEGEPAPARPDEDYWP